LQAEFLSLVLLFVYVGAVMTLFLFVVMMISIDRAETQTSFVRYYPFGFLVFVVFTAIACYVFMHEHWAFTSMLPAIHDEKYNNVQVMGNLLMTRYLLPFEMSAVLLLVGMVAAIALAFHGRKADTKTQSIRAQLNANKKDRLRMIDLKKGDE